MFLKRFCVLAIVAAAAAMTVSVSAQTTRMMRAPAQDEWKLRPPVNNSTIGLVLRQDLFDRNDPNNLRSDYPGPPAQPGAVR
jgi:hypothetical protein